MNVYYKRVTTWQKWPDNDLVDEDYISYSLSRKRWNEFHKTTQLPDMNQRAKIIAECLRVKVSKVNLIKP